MNEAHALAWMEHRYFEEALRFPTMRKKITLERYRRVNLAATMALPCEGCEEDYPHPYVGDDGPAWITNPTGEWDRVKVRKGK